MNDAFPLDAAVFVATAPTPGAVAIVQLDGPDAVALLGRLTHRTSWTPGRAVLVDLGGIDEGLAILWQQDMAQLMPHGGPRVVQRLMGHLVALGATPVDPLSRPASRLFPEADSAIEADMLLAMAQAASPVSVDLLLAQPDRWRQAVASSQPMDWAAIARQSLSWDRLLSPPMVAVVGRPNVGKSTLTNALLGRAASLVADMPGTTRDWVAGMATIGGVAVRWLDTPGVRQSDDLIEQQAIAMAGQVVAQAEVVVAMRDPHTPWPEQESLARQADVWVVNKMDDVFHARSAAHGHEMPAPDLGRDAAAPLPLSAMHLHGLDALGRCVLDVLGLGSLSAEQDRAPAGLWAFSPALRQAVARRDDAFLGDYLASH